MAASMVMQCSSNVAVQILRTSAVGSPRVVQHHMHLLRIGQVKKTSVAPAIQLQQCQ